MPNILDFGGTGLSNSIVSALTAEPNDVLNGKTFIGAGQSNVLGGA